jgi:LCP family protein required for cell wall assembly
VSGARSDTAILVHVAGSRQWASGLSIPRDPVTRIPTRLKACGGLSRDRTARFNEAYSRGGALCATATVQAMTGLHVDHVVVIGFAGFIHAIDTLGGLTVCLRHQVTDSKSRLDLPRGVQRLSGTQALALARVRHGLSDGSDTARTHRQQYLLTLLADQVRAAGLLTDPVTAYRLAEDLTGALTTDRALGSVQALTALALQLRESSAARLHLSTLPYRPDPASWATVVVDTRASAPLLAGMAADVEPARSRAARAGAAAPSPTASHPAVTPDAIAGADLCPVA